MFAGKRNFLVAFFQAVLRLDCEGDSMALTDTAIKLAKVGNVDRKRTDDRGLYLLVTLSLSLLVLGLERRFGSAQHA